MPNYELVYIVRPDLEEDQLTAMVDKISQVVAAEGGQVTRVDSWGKRRLAYPVRKFNEGYYVVKQLTLELPALPGLERNLRLTEEVIRYLVVRVDEE